METTLFEYEGYKIPVDLVNLTGAGPDSFEIIAKGHFATLRKVVGIQPHHSVLEIGCGIGRDAITLASFLSDAGSYTGVDIIKRSISWCQDNISVRHSNFKFLHYDVADQLHNPSGTTHTLDIALPLPSGSVDRIILWSVFTHMFERDIVHYMREFSRLLRPDGLVFATCFIVSPSIIASARKTNLTPYDLRFEHDFGRGCFINDPAHPAGAVAYSEEALNRMVRQGVLELAEPFHFGNWSGYLENQDPGQDWMVLRRAKSQGVLNRLLRAAFHPGTTRG